MEETELGAENINFGIGSLDLNPVREEVKTIEREQDVFVEEIDEEEEEKQELGQSFLHQLNNP